MRTILECQKRARTWKEEEKFWTQASECFWMAMGILGWGMLILSIYRVV